VIAGLVTHVAHYVIARSLWDELRSAGAPVVVGGIAAIAVVWFLRRRRA
jgi:hypothetical protein